MGLTRDFPLFPLRLVALPGELIPLHIFEERYKLMMARCLSEPTEFGIVCVADDELREVGCACEIAEVLERFDDGRLNLVARGTRVFRIQARQEELDYPAGTVEFLSDSDAAAGPELLAEVHAAYAELVREATDREPDLAEIASLGAYGMAATIEFGLDAKQDLLGLRSEPDRLELLLRLLRSAIDRLGHMEQVRERARSNGRTRFDPGTTGP